MGPEHIPWRKDGPVREIRRARLEDHEAVVRVMPEWWADSRTPEQEEAAAAGRTKVKAITSPANTGSIAFHRAMGFDVHEPKPGYDGPGQDRVRFERTL